MRLGPNHESQYNYSGPELQRYHPYHVYFHYHYHCRERALIFIHIVSFPNTPTFILALILQYLYIPAYPHLHPLTCSIFSHGCIFIAIDFHLTFTSIEYSDVDNCV